ncbi:MAG: hypothetical protein ING89_15335 [Rubrivivax sp.]|nr:hypothetical protein [Rubrivivax sp.]
MPISASTPATETLRLAWLVPSTKYDQASVRYRCAHPLANLAMRGCTNVVFKDMRSLLERIDDADAVVAVKRLDPDLIPLAARCDDLGKAFYIDLCDDIVSPARPTQGRRAPLALLRALAPLTTAFICPTPSMRDRILDYLRESGIGAARVEVIPDCIETEAVYRLSQVAWARVVGAGAGAATEEAGHRMPEDDKPNGAPAVRIQLCWFGNWGGPHSDFGITSLIPVIGQLNGYANRSEIALRIISNHAELGALIQQRARFAVEYREWSRAEVAASLAQAHFALVTSGDDQFSVIKSPNRSLLALASGVPVIVDADAESADAIWACRDEVPGTDRLLSILDEVRETGYEPVRSRLLASARPGLDRFRLERLGARYVELFRASGRAAAAHVPASLNRLAHCMGEDEDLGLALRIHQWCLEQGVEFLAIASFKSLQSRKKLFSFLAERQIKPSVVFDAQATAAETQRLRGADLVVMSSAAERGFGLRVREWADALRVPVWSQGEFLYRMAWQGGAFPRALPAAAGAGAA